ncbi:plasmid mobilization protein [Eubacterium ventriosum]|uniref:plasmid mobilization protein n=1 Tax=Eubacterium ventriosum TaxID=39496 RepID=UPI002670F465|nr:hypothetical protein [Eubacterium ventriosum]
MPGVHKKPTISFRVSDAERIQIDANIKASGMSKQSYFVKSCIYNRVCVVGKKETIDPLVEKLKTMQKSLVELSHQIEKDGGAIDSEELTNLEEQYKAMLSAIIKMLDAAEYLWNPNKKSPKQ